MPDIKLYIACHKQVQLPKHPFFYPVQAGSALVAEAFSDMLHDNDGNNISAKNGSYCELTVQYWVWKNQLADYYGFFHYRRFLAFKPEQKQICTIYMRPDDFVLQQNRYALETITPFIQQYDLILPRGEHTAETVYQKYVSAEHHYSEDLDLIMALISQHQSDYQEAMQRYMYGHTQYYYNMYIMRHELFHQYCLWLFPLLQQFDQCNNWDKYGDDKTAMRVDGYLAERLFGVWYTYQKMNRALRCIELPWMYFTMGDKKAYCETWLKNKLLPAGSKRKRIVQQLKRKGEALR